MRKWEIFRRLGEPFVAGFFQRENASYLVRHADAICSHLAHAPLPEYEPGARLYPSGRSGIWNADPEERVRFFYSFSLSVDGAALRRKEERLTTDFERRVFREGVAELEFLVQSVIPPEYAVGGRGWSHGVIHYERVLREGWQGYRRRIEAAQTRNPEFYGAVLIVLNALSDYVRRAVTELKRRGADPALIAALERVPEQPPRTLYEAFVGCNFLWYLDDCDSCGRIDRVLGSYRRGESEREVQELFRLLWRNFDMNDGWHVLLDPRESLCRAAIQAQRGYRRPNSGILIDEETPPEVWEAIFDSWASSNPSPALYSRRNYERGVQTGLGVPPEEAGEFAFGGCSELMVQGKSHVASLDAGINLLRILSATGVRFASYEEFYAQFTADIRRHLDRLVRAIRENAKFRADYQPQLIRTLFMDDCLDRGLEFNAGGVRYHGSAVNVAGLNNVVNSLVVLKQLYAGKLGVSVAEFAAWLERDFEGNPLLLARVRQLPKFGNDQEEADALASELSAMIFGYLSGCSRADHWILPAIIMFATYGELGTTVPATPEGRGAGRPLGDSCGPVQGTDRNGPTAMLRSVAALDQAHAPGSLVLNLRLSRKVLQSPEGRAQCRALFLTYFQLGGLQVQVTVADTQTLREAVRDPAAHEGLIIRIGGYSEYFNRLSPELKEEVIRREEHLAASE